MAENDLAHQQALLKTHRDRRAVIERQLAAIGDLNADPRLELEIKELNAKIDELERQVSGVPLYEIRSLPLPLQKYDGFLQQLFSYLPSREDDLHKFRSRLLQALGMALGAERTFIARDIGTGWDEIASYTNTQGGNGARAQPDNEIEALLHRAVRYVKEAPKIDPNKYEGVIFGVRPRDRHAVVVTPLTDLTPIEVLVLEGVAVDFEIDTAFSAILTSLIRTTSNLTASVTAYTIQTDILNTLKRSFSYVSDWMYERQFALFKEKLKTIVMFFEPILSLSYYPYICRWEALARDPLTYKAPRDLFETAELWGRAFQLELDMHCLLTAVESYRELPERPTNSRDSRLLNDATRKSVVEEKRERTAYKVRVGDLLPLSINVYPETLVRRVYRETIVSLAKKRLMPLDKITLEISEKVPLPPPEGALPGQDEVTWFRDRLRFYTKLGLSIAIDDYGVGFASASRLSRLEPAIVKIDRDALLHAQGSYTIQHVLRLEQEGMGKLQVIVEGFDDESKISLLELQQLGIRYVQGHAIGMPVPARSLYRLNEDQEAELARKAGLL